MPGKRISIKYNEMLLEIFSLHANAKSNQFKKQSFNLDTFKSSFENIILSSIGSENIDEGSH